MSVIRFLHTGHLRLGSSVAGMADCPDWLRRAVDSAVRRAVTNTAEKAIATRCRFVLVSGRITEHDEDLDTAVTWLSGVADELRREGIRLVLTGCDPKDFTRLRRLGAILCGPDQTVEVFEDADHKECFSVRDTAGMPPHAGSLMIRPATELTAAGVCSPTTLCSVTNGRFDYFAAAAGIAETGRRSLSSPHPSGEDGGGLITATQSGQVLSEKELSHRTRVRSVRVVAGSPQAVSPDESGPFGCQCVEVAPASGTISIHTEPTDILRFVVERIRTACVLSATELTTVIRERSRLIGQTPGRTVVVDWIIDGRVAATLSPGDALDEQSLMRSLRAQLQSGHSGIWPRRLRFAESSLFVARDPLRPFVQEFLNATSESNLGSQNSNETEYRCHVAAGLEILARVA